MKLLEEKRANRPMPTPVSKPDPPPERIVTGKEPTIGSSLLPSIASTLSETPVETAPVDSGKKNPATDTTKSQKKASSGRERNRRRGKGDHRPKSSPKKTGQDSSSPTAQAGLQSAAPSGEATAAETDATATGGEGQKKSGRKRKRRRRRKSGPKE